MLDKRIFTINERQHALAEMKRLNPNPPQQEPYSPPAEIELQNANLWATAPQESQPLMVEHKCSRAYYGCYCDTENQLDLGRSTGSLPPIISARYRVPSNTLPISTVAPFS